MTLDSHKIIIIIALIMNIGIWLCASRLVNYVAGSKPFNSLIIILLFFCLNYYNFYTGIFISIRQKVLEKLRAYR